MKETERLDDLDEALSGWMGRSGDPRLYVLSFIESEAIYGAVEIMSTSSLLPKLEGERLGMKIHLCRRVYSTASIQCSDTRPTQKQDPDAMNHSIRTSSCSEHRYAAFQEWLWAEMRKSEENTYSENKDEEKNTHWKERQ